MHNLRKINIFSPAGDLSTFLVSDGFLQQIENYYETEVYPNLGNQQKVSQLTPTGKNVEQFVCISEVTRTTCAILWTGLKGTKPMNTSMHRQPVCTSNENHLCHNELQNNIKRTIKNGTLVNHPWPPIV